MGLDTDTNTAGSRSGTVTIDNLDITTAGGTGRGANDGDDTINLSLTVLDHATPSFDETNEVITLSHDFGQIAEGDSADILNFSLHNLVGTAGFTSGLELDSITPDGDDDHFFTNLMTFDGFSALEAGDSQSALAAMLTDEMGSFSASYTLGFSDLDFAGEQSYSLTLNLSGEVIAAGLAGDFNNDNVVDAADYTAWRDGLGDTYTMADYTVWRSNFGVSAAAGGKAVGAVPETSCVFMLVLAASFMSFFLQPQRCPR